MEAKELRIGNWVNRWMLNHINKVDCIQIQPYDFSRWNEYGHKPIPLTEEWLVKFGFEKDETLYTAEHHWIDWVKEDVRISLPYFDFSYNDNESTISIKHAHSLQNLYFALTGKELTIK